MTTSLLLATIAIPTFAIILHILLAILFALFCIFAISCFISDFKIMQVVRIIFGILVLMYALQEFAIIQ